MNFEVFLQNITYIRCNVLSYLPKSTEIDLFACMCFFSNSDHLMFSRRKIVNFNKGGFRGEPAPFPPPFCGLLNISALHVHYGIQAFAKFKRPDALDCISENFNLKVFLEGACARNYLEKCTVRSPDGLHRAHIATVYYISRPPLSQNPPSASV